MAVGLSGSIRVMIVLCQSFFIRHVSTMYAGEMNAGLIGYFAAGQA